MDVEQFIGYAPITLIGCPQISNLIAWNIRGGDIILISEIVGRSGDGCEFVADRTMIVRLSYLIHCPDFLCNFRVELGRNFLDRCWYWLGDGE